MVPYELCIIGAGMIGSAAAYHATKLTSGKVCLIGTSEPKDRDSQDIFGAYYDQGRIVRRTDGKRVWAQLAKEAEDNFCMLRQETGIDFFTPIGSLTVGTRDSKYISGLEKNAKDMSIPYDILTANQIMGNFPYIHISKDSVSIYEKEHSGYLNPRRLVDVQRLAAHKRGCDIIHDIACGLRKLSDWSIEVMLESGRVIHAKTVLLTTGAFIQSRPLVPDKLQPDILLARQTIVLAEVSADDRIRMRDMPSLVVETKFVGSPTEALQCYIVPPLLFPDGKYYLKIGHNGEEFDVELTPDKVKDWYRGPGDPAAEDYLKRALTDLFPDFKPLSFKTDTCVTSHTPGVRLYIDWLSPGLAVALGCNGYAAKSCNAIGLRAAMLALKLENTRPEFKVALKTTSSKL